MLFVGGNDKHFSLIGVSYFYGNDVISNLVNLIGCSYGGVLVDGATIGYNDKHVFNWKKLKCDNITELQIRRGIKDNATIFCLISQRTHML